MRLTVEARIVRVGVLGALCIAALLGALGCGLPVGGASDFGATQGGVQDMGFARELIAAGRVPPAEALLVEAMFSEHDLPLTGEPTADLLGLRAAAGWCPDATGAAAAWVQVGLSSSVDMETYVRPSVSLVACVDVSGSMGWTYETGSGESPTPGQVARALLRVIAPQLGAADEFAVVTYDSTVRTPLPFTSGDNQEAIVEVIDGLSAGGSTAMEAGLEAAYEVATGAREGSDARVLLFTDAQPNVGAATPTEFERLAAAGADQDVGLTVFAIGVGMGSEVLEAISHLRGGSAFTLFDCEDVDELMADDWPWLLTPIAYDLRVSAAPAAGFTVAEAYGFPQGGEEPQAELEVSSVFLSRRRGALLIRLAPGEAVTADALGAVLDLSYTTPAGDAVARQVTVAARVRPLDALGACFDQPSVGKSVALAALVSSMRDAAERYEEAPERAAETLAGAVAWFASISESLGDASLAPELKLASDMLSLVREGAPQGDMYEYGN